MPESQNERGGQTVDLASLSVQNLSQLKKQLDAELEHLTSSFQSLRSAQAKFRDCLKSISTGLSASASGTNPSFSNSNPKLHIVGASSWRHLTSFFTPDKSILVPLTSSLYVPGVLASTTTVLVDVGTGFYVEKSTADATDFYNRKVEELGKNLKDLEQIVNGKGNNLRVVEEVLRQKMLAGNAGASATSAA